MPWDDYLAKTIADWEAALASTRERAVHDCLALHPSLLPLQRSGDPGALGHHGAWMDAVITEPPLEGFRRRVPDFMWFERTSASVTAVCLELERPSKYWFRKDGVQTADLRQALDQIQEWREWFADHRPEELFEAYRLPQEWLVQRRFNQRYILLYGRRAQRRRAGRRAQSLTRVPVLVMVRMLTT
jgi:hypothetical protein